LHLITAVDRSPVRLTEAQVLAGLQRIGQVQLGVTRTIKPSDELYRDLDLDSVQIITLVIEIETYFKVALTTEAAARARTVGDLCRILAEQAPPCD
jgi:acyl carrier protein